MDIRCQATTLQGKQCTRKPTHGAHCTQHKNIKLEKFECPNGKKVVVQNIIYEAIVEKEKVCFVLGSFLIETKPFKILKRDIVRKIMDFLSSDDCLNFGLTCKENKEFFYDEDYWKFRNSKYLGNHNVSKDSNRKLAFFYNKWFTKEALEKAAKTGMLELNFSHSVVCLLNGILIPYAKRCLFCPLEEYPDMLKKELPNYVFEDRLPFCEKVLEMWDTSQRKHTPIIKFVNFLIAFLRTEYTSKKRRTVNVTEYNIYYFIFRFCDFGKNDDKHHIPYFITYLKSKIPAFCYGYEFRNAAGRPVLSDRDYAENGILRDLKNMEMNDYHIGLIAIGEFLEKVFFKDSEDLAKHIMVQKKRSFFCLDDEYPCYGCGKLSVGCQVMRNILEVSPKRETFNDLMIAIQFANEIVGNDTIEKCFLLYFDHCIPNEISK
jgi:hypothetical protein